MSSVCNWYRTLPGIVLSLPVGCDDPSVAGVGAAHFLSEPVPVTDGEAAVVVFVHNCVYPRVARRDTGTHVGHHGRHEDVAGAFPRVEGTPLPPQRYSHDLQLRRGEAGAVASPECDSLVPGNPEEVACRIEGEQQPWVSGIGVRVERPVDQLRLDELLDLGLPPDR